VPFEGTGIPQLDGKTSAEIWRDYALAVGGTLMPTRSRSERGVHGFVGPVADDYLPALPAALQPKERDSYGGNFLTASQAEGLEDGWNFLTVESEGARRTLLVYADRTPPVLVLDERVPLEIHPDDVPFGLRLEGDIIDYVAGIRTVNTVNRSYPDVEVDDDGMVHVFYPVKDAAGNVTEVPYAVRVTETAKRRGQNRSFYLQSRPDLR
jgi:hypothetical protein